MVFSFAPVFWEDDFKGAGRLTDAGPNVRWLFMLKYPDGVSIDQGDAWFKEVFAPEVCANPEVNRLISSRQLDDPRINPFHRITEVWFDDSEGWRKAFVEKAGQYTKPFWAVWDELPYFEPFRDFVGIFILDRPESDHLQQWRGYITTPLTTRGEFMGASTTFTPRKEALARTLSRSATTTWMASLGSDGYAGGERALLPLRRDVQASRLAHSR